MTRVPPMVHPAGLDVPRRAPAFSNLNSHFTPPIFTLPYCEDRRKDVLG